MGPRAPLPVSVSEARRDCYRRYSGLDVGVEDVAARAGESERQGEDMENGGQTQERTQGMPTVDEKAGGDEVGNESLLDSFIRLFYVVFFLTAKRPQMCFPPYLLEGHFFVQEGGYSWS